jgi:hypothetical protein
MSLREKERDELLIRLTAKWFTGVLNCCKTDDVSKSLFCLFVLFVVTCWMR